LVERFATNGPRKRLADGMLNALHDLKSEGIEDVYLGGSFPTTKPVPGDFDLTYRASKETEAQLYTRLPLLRDRDLMKEAYGGELIPNHQEYFLQNRTSRSVGILKLDMNSLPPRVSEQSPAYAVMQKYGGVKVLGRKLELADVVRKSREWQIEHFW
jgi:hypothetical protein